MAEDTEQAQDFDPVVDAQNAAIAALDLEQPEEDTAEDKPEEKSSTKAKK